MRKKLVVAACGYAVASSVAMAAPGSAEVVSGLTASMTPTSVHPGGTITVSPNEACPAGSSSLHWTLDTGVINGDSVVADGQGRWAVAFAAPDTAGSHRFLGVCMASGSPTAEYDALEFTVEAGPAQPRSGHPEHTG